MAYSDEDIYGLAQQAGIASPTSNPGGTDPYAQDPNTPQDSSYGFAPPDPRPTSPLGDAAPARYPGTLQGDLTPPDPLDVTGLPQGSPLAPGASIGSSRSAEARGLNFDTLGKLDKRTQLQKENAASLKQAQDLLAPATEAADQAQTSEKAAAQDVADATANKVTAEGGFALELKTLADDSAHRLAIMNAQHTAAENSRMADYMTAFNDFRAQRVDPNQLWGDLSGGQRFGTLTSVFVHDFLGVKGIKTSTMDIINNAVDRNIKAQVENIKHKGDVAAGFKELWTMQRAQSQSDDEAFMRMRPFMLESVKQGIVSKMAPYESALASAQGKQALAKIDGEHAKSILQVQDAVVKSYDAQRGQNTTLEGDRLKAAVEMAKIAAQERERKAAAKAVVAPDTIVDPETNINKWQFKPGTTIEGKNKTTDAVIDVANINRGIKELQALERTMDPTFDGFKGTRLSTEDQRKYEAIRDSLAYHMAKADAGRIANQAEQEAYKAKMPTPTTFTRGGVQTILANTRRTSIDRANDTIQQHAVDLPKELQTQGPQGRAFAGSETEAKIQESGKTNEISKSATSMAIGAIHGDNAKSAASDETYAAVGLGGKDGKIGAEYEWTNFADKHPGAYKNKLPGAGQAAGMAADALGNFVSKGELPSGDPADALVADKEPPTYAVGIIALGQEARKHNPDAMAELSKLAAAPVTGNEDDDSSTQRALALYELHQISLEEHPHSPKAATSNYKFKTSGPE